MANEDHAVGSVPPSRERPASRALQRSGTAPLPFGTAGGGMDGLWADVPHFRGGADRPSTVGSVAWAAEAGRATRPLSRLSRLPEIVDEIADGQKRKLQSKRRVEQRQQEMESWREDDRRRRLDHMDKEKSLRGERFERLWEGLEQDTVVPEVAAKLHARGVASLMSKKILHRKWQEQVEGCVRKQIVRHMELGERGVRFTLPGEQWKATLPARADPLKEERFLKEKEDAFFNALGAAAEGRPVSRWVPAKLFRPISAPDLLHPSDGCFARGPIGPYEPQPPPRRALVPGLSRPTLEPTEWSQLRLAEVPCVRSAQQWEKLGDPPPRPPPPRSGADIKRCYAPRPGDPGSGFGNGCLAQDHYNFAQCDKVPDSEFPLGKRIFPHMH